MDDAQHRAVVVAQYDRADSTSSAMIETLGAERQMVIVAHDMAGRSCDRPVQSVPKHTADTSAAAPCDLRAGLKKKLSDFSEL